MKDLLHRPALVAVVAVLGVLVALAFNTTQRAPAQQPDDRTADLAVVVGGLETERETLEERLAELRAAMEELEEQAAEESGVRETYLLELERAREAAGLSAVEGPGVEVTLGDGTDLPDGADPNDYLIHDSDLVAVVNALLNGGAEAVDINGQRVVSTSPIRCAGTTILVNSNRCGSPYVIRAIGDPESLEDALLEDPVASPLFTQYRTQFGLEATIDRKLEVTVEPYRGSVRPEYAQAEEDSS
jgi:uncharacterized protein YlxW (UPF0749 family)